MKRTHRTAHRTIWIIVTVAIAAGLCAALVLRKPQKKKKAEGPAIVLALSSAHQIPGVHP